MNYYCPGEQSHSHYELFYTQELGSTFLMKRYMNIIQNCQEGSGRVGTEAKN